jgi:acyl-CoA dehydrogenase-like protein
LAKDRRFCCNNDQRKIASSHGRFLANGGPEPDRARLAGSHAITNAVAVADTTYKAAGVDAIFPGSPFERRFRDIHTVSQQIQSRNAHYGQVLLGNPGRGVFIGAASGTRPRTFPRSQAGHK